MSWDKWTSDVLEEVQEAEKLAAGPDGPNATITAECGSFYTLACCA